MIGSWTLRSGLCLTVAAVLSLAISSALAENAQNEPPRDPPPLWKQAIQRVESMAKADLPRSQRTDQILKALHGELKNPTKAKSPERWHSELMPSEHVQLAILKALVELKHPDGIRNMLRTSQTVPAATGEGGPRKAGDDINRGITKRLQIVLCMLGEAGAVPKAMSLAKDDPDPFVRFLAVRALGMAKDERAIPVLKAALSDPHSRRAAEVIVEGGARIFIVRREAACSLMQLGVKVKRVSFNEWKVVQE